LFTIKSPDIPVTNAFTLLEPGLAQLLSFLIPESPEAIIETIIHKLALEARIIILIIRYFLYEDTVISVNFIIENAFKGPVCIGFNHFFNIPASTAQ
jgi:hypothetical protein